MDYSEGIKALILGLSTVFLVLVLISLVISMFKHINFEKKAKPAKTVETPKALKAISVVEKKEEDLEIIVVLTAAIAASLNTTTDRLHVTSFRRVGGGSRGWKAR